MRWPYRSIVIAADACPRIRWTTLGSAPAPSQMDAAVCRRSCGRSVGRPIVVVARGQTIERFQFDSLSGPPCGAGNSQSSAALAAAQRSTIVARLGRQRHRSCPAPLERVHVRGSRRGCSRARLVGGPDRVRDLDEIAHAQTRQLAPAQTTEPENGDQLGIPASGSAGEVVELVESEELPLAARLSSLRKWDPRGDVPGEPAVGYREREHRAERAQVAVGRRGRAAALDEPADPVGHLRPRDRGQGRIAEPRLDVVAPGRLVDLSRLALEGATGL